MRAIANAVLIGSLMVAIAVGFAIFLSSEEASKESTLRTVLAGMKDVQDVHLLTYLILSFEKSFLQEKLEEKLSFLTEDETSLLGDANAFVPADDVLEDVINIMDNVLGFRSTYERGFRSVHSKELNGYVVMDINQEGEIRIEREERIFSIRTPHRTYFLPVPIGTVRDVVEGLNKTVRIHAYVGFYEDGSDLCFYDGTHHCGCIDEVLPNLLDPEGSFSSLISTSDVISSIPLDVNISLSCTPDYHPHFDLIYTTPAGSSQTVPGGYLLEGYDCTLELNVPIPPNRILTVRYSFRVDVKDDFPFTPKGPIGNVELSGGYYHKPGVTCP